MKKIKISGRELYLRFAFDTEEKPEQYNAKFVVSSEEVRRNKDIRKLLEIKMKDGVDDMLDLLFTNDVSFSTKMTEEVF